MNGRTLSSAYIRFIRTYSTRAPSARLLLFGSYVYSLEPRVLGTRGTRFDVCCMDFVRCWLPLRPNAMCENDADIITGVRVVVPHRHIQNSCNIIDIPLSSMPPTPPPAANNDRPVRWFAHHHQHSVNIHIQRVFASTPFNQEADGNGTKG